MSKNFLLKALMHLIAFLWMGLFAFVVALVIEIGASEHTIRGFFGGILFLATLFWLIDIFLFRILKKRFGTKDFTYYPNDYPKWKKVIHYSTCGKYEKYYE